MGKYSCALPRSGRFSASRVEALAEFSKFPRAAVKGELPKEAYKKIPVRLVALAKMANCFIRLPSEDGAACKVVNPSWEVKDFLKVLVFQGYFVDLRLNKLKLTESGMVMLFFMMRAMDGG